MSDVPSGVLSVPRFSYHLTLPYPPRWVDFWKPVPDYSQRIKQKTRDGYHYVHEVMDIVQEFQKSEGAGIIISPCRLEVIFKLPKNQKEGHGICNNLAIVEHCLETAKLVQSKRCFRECSASYVAYHEHKHFKTKGRVEVFVESMVVHE